MTNNIITAIASLIAATVTLLETLGQLEKYIPVRLKAVFPNWSIWITVVVLIAVAVYCQWERIQGFLTRFSAHLERWRPLIVFCCLATSVVILTISIGICISMKRIVNLSATKYVGKFPSNLNTIIDLVNNAKQELIIVTDHPAYGTLSAPELSRKYLKALEEAARGRNKVEVNLYVFDSATRSNALIKQFDMGRDGGVNLANKIESKHPGVAKKFTDWGLLPENKDFRNGSLSESSSEGTYRNFISALTKKNVAVLKSLETDGGVKCEEISETVPVFIWIADRKTAVFSFYTAGAGKDLEEVSFFTNDPNSIDLLMQIYRSRSGKN